MGTGFLGLQRDGETMAKERSGEGTAPETVISIIGPGMKVVGDCQTDGTIRIDGHVEGTIRAGKAVVVGKEGHVEGDIHTQDAVVSGRLDGTLHAESRLELQATSRIDGEVYARRMQLEEGAILNGSVTMGESAVRAAGGRTPESGASRPQGSESRGREKAVSGAGD